MMSSWASAELQVQDGYVRALPPGVPVTAAFMTLINTADTDVKITGGKSNAAETLELHTHRHVNGMMSMQQVPSVDIPAKGEFAFVPGSYHIMLMNLTKPLRAGDVVTLQLHSDEQVVLDVELPVRSVVNEHAHH